MSDESKTDFSEASFWDKLKGHALTAGAQVVERALRLYYALQAPKTPKWAKTVILGALAYFILPADAIPDMVPLAGYSDDLGALTAALATVQMYVTDDIKAQAKSKLRQWFGERGSASATD